MKAKKTTNKTQNKTQNKQSNASKMVSTSDTKNCK